MRGFHRLVAVVFSRYNIQIDGIIRFNRVRMLADHAQPMKAMNVSTIPPVQSALFQGTITYRRNKVGVNPIFHFCGYRSHLFDTLKKNDLLSALERVSHEPQYASGS